MREPDDARVKALVNQQADALLARGRQELAAERFDTALQEFQRVFTLRPGDPSAQAAIKQVDISRRIAGVKQLNRTEDRAQVLDALDALRKLAPDDAGVSSLRDSIYDPRRAVTNTIGMKLELVPAGEFLIGSPNDDADAQISEQPQHRVRITRAFYLGALEVTRGQFRQFVDDAGYQTEAEKDGKGIWVFNKETRKPERNPLYNWRNPGFEQTDEHPVVDVSLNDAQAFVAWLSRKEGEEYRLPTEAEWEYACRAGTTTKYFCGDDPEGLAVVGNVRDGTKNPGMWQGIAVQDGYVYTAPVGRFQANAFGLYDMHGNVWEWCSNCGSYMRLPVDDPTGRVAPPFDAMNRGGSWHSFPRADRSAFRRAYGCDNADAELGFRVVRVQSAR